MVLVPSCIAAYINEVVTGTLPPTAQCKSEELAYSSCLVAR